jgi:hypothetical protein
MSALLLLLVFTGWSQGSVKNEGVRFRLERILVQADSFYIDLSLKNSSLIGYKPAFIKLFIRDRHIAKRTAVQEKEIIPVFATRLLEVSADSMQNIALILPVFTIAKNKELVFEIVERNGVRTMQLHIKGHRLLKIVRKKN